ncbi:MAG TPA: hypothetical protein VK982_01525 [Bacteroidales bacterium]|nr:hypothetical protein [Bacteroidales bacterium]
MYQKIRALIVEKDLVVVFDASNKPIKKSQFIADIREAEAEAQIEKGEYITIEELEKESEKW